jgi:hypothetical protein
LQAYCILYLIIGSAELFLVTESFGIAFAFGIVLNYYKQYTCAKIAAVILSNLTIVAITYLFSMKGGVQYYFIPAALAAQFLFKPNNKKAIFLTALIPMMLYLFFIHL